MTFTEKELVDILAAIRGADPELALGMGRSEGRMERWEALFTKICAHLKETPSVPR